MYQGAFVLYLAVIAAASTAPAATPSSTASCVPKPSVQPGYHCNEPGGLKQSDPISRFNSPKSNYADCYAACRQNTKCVSFSYNTQTKQCSSYGSTLVTQGFTHVDQSPVIYWNLKGCFDLSATCPIPTAASTSTVHSTTSSGSLSATTSHASGTTSSTATGSTGINSSSSTQNTSSGSSSSSSSTGASTNSTPTSTSSGSSSSTASGTSSSTQSTSSGSSTASSTSSTSTTSTSTSGTTSLTSTTPSPSSTSVSSSTSTTTSSSPYQTANAPCQQVGYVDGTTYQSLVVTAGTRTVPNNNDPNCGYYASVNFPTIQSTLDGTLSACDAITQCVQAAYTTGFQYYGVDLHYLLTEQQWSCWLYYDDIQASCFSVTDADVGQTYGYSYVANAGGD